MGRECVRDGFHVQNIKEVSDFFLTNQRHIAMIPFIESVLISCV